MKKFINFLSFFGTAAHVIAESCKKLIPAFETLRKDNSADRLSAPVIVEKSEVTNA